MALATKPKKTTLHKKRRAQHHSHSKHYLKTYWPYLPMLTIVGVGLIINSLWSNQSVLGTFNDYSVQTLLSETNERRAADKEAPLTLNPQLSAAAQAKAEDMAAKNYWSHTSADGKAPWVFVAESGYQYQSTGENLAYGFSNADEIIAGWMSSPQHRSNLLNAAYQHVGFGVAQSQNYQGLGPETIVVAEYGQPAGSVLGTEATPPAANDLPAKNVARIDVLTKGQATWSALAIGVITGAALMLFIIRHGFHIKRLLSNGEAFVVHHPYIDIAVVAVLTIGYLLTRPGGIIQ